MKKVLLFGVSVVMIFAINFLSIQTSHSEEVSTMRWKEVVCFDGQTHYEICFYTGNGNLCSTWGMTTRNCPENPN